MENEIPGPGRIPKQTDLVVLCRALNQEDARYVVIGGFAIIRHGFIRGQILATPSVRNALAYDVRKPDHRYS